MTLSRLIRHVSIALALSFCLSPAISNATVVAPTANVYTWTASAPGLFLANSVYASTTALDTAQGSNAGLYVYPSNTTFSAGYNLENTDMVIQTPNATVAAAAYQDLYDMLKAGHAGSWSGGGSGVGIYSDTTAYNAAHSTNYPSGHTDSSGLTGLSIEINDGIGHDPSYTSFDVDPNTGNPILTNADSILIKYTYNGDTADRDFVQLSDVTNAVNGYLASQSASPGGSGWSNGESTYDGSVELSDLSNAINSYEYFQSGGVSVVGPSGDQTAQLGAESASGFASPVGVPEPGTGIMGLLAIVGFAGAWAVRRKSVCGSI